MRREGGRTGLEVLTALHCVQGEAGKDAFSGDLSLSGGGVGDAKELWVRGYQGYILTLLLMY